MFEQSRLLSLSGRVYSLLLLAYPTRFRRAFGREMAQVFRDDLRNTLQESGPNGLASLWLLVEVFHMPVSKLERFTGLAAVLGGALFVFISLVDLGLSNFYSFLLLMLPIVILWGIGLIGLYRRLPKRAYPGSVITFGLAMICLLLIAVGVLLLTPEAEFAWTLLMIGFYGLVLGLGGMGVIALVHGGLGIWRFVPLVLAGVFLGTLISGSEAESINNPVQLTFIILTGIGWLLLGISLWSRPEDVPGPALPA